MVSYQKWTQIAFEVARGKGMNTSDPGANRDLISVAAEVWRDRKDDLATATDAEARRIAKDEIQIA